ncbi:MAG TPA: tripartite tricarboxylate transporter substrate binding protein [Pseudolabrys sp.]|nr:tripartite tricarboxylate transporter substrate binding protein [Pseudolabrys sp.]
MRHLTGLAIALALAMNPATTRAQDAWPSRLITLIVPYGAGGYTDVVARITAHYLQKELGKTVIAENRPGAGGIVGTQAVVNAAPDGYTLCICSGGAITIAPFTQKVPYDPVKDLAPIGIVSSVPMVVVTRKDLPVTSLPEFVSYAKAHPGKLNYASNGAGGITHYAVELFLARTGATAVHIPFKGGAESIASLFSGHADFAFSNLTDALPQIKAGTVRGLAVTSNERSSYLPDLPTVRKTVVPNFFAETWNGIMAPAKTPEPIVRKISEILLRMADDPEVKQGMRTVGADTVKTTPDQFRAMIQQEIAEWKPLSAEIEKKK